MATSNQEQALQEVGRYLQINSESRTRLIRRAQVNSFQRRMNLQLEPWRVNPSNSMTCIQLWNHYSAIYANLKVVLLKEAIGLGSSQYCICHNWGCDFYKRLKLIMSFLPLEKMFLYHADVTLGGSFLQELWLSQGCILIAQPSLTFNEFHDNLHPHNKWIFCTIPLPCME